MAVNSKAKGAKAERDLAKWWEKWTGYKFSRTPMSGGWHKNTETTSDLVCVDEKHKRRFPFSVESKSHKEINFNDILKGNKSDILKWWDQCKGDALRGKKIPLLFMRENGMKKSTWFVVMNYQLYSSIWKGFNPEIIEGRVIYLFAEGQALFIIPSTTLEDLNYRKVYHKARKLIKNAKRT